MQSRTKGSGADEGVRPTAFAIRTSETQHLGFADHRDLCASAVLLTDLKPRVRKTHQNPSSLNPGSPSGRRPSGQRYFRSLSSMARSLMLAYLNRIKPFSSNSQFSFP